MTALVISNKEIEWIFEEQKQDWFQAESKKDIQTLENFCRAFEKNDITAIEIHRLPHIENMKGKIVIILNNANNHLSKLLIEFLEKNKKRSELFFLPLYNPILNRIGQLLE